MEFSEAFQKGELRPHVLDGDGAGKRRGDHGTLLQAGKCLLALVWKACERNRVRGGIVSEEFGDHGVTTGYQATSFGFERFT